MEENRKPVVDGTAPELKTNANSNYYFWGSDFLKGDPVKITHEATGVVWWEGSIKQIKGAVARAQVNYVGPPFVKPGDTEWVTVTVTNTGVPSEPQQVIVDGPS